jgi:hypothetical protein
VNREFDSNESDVSDLHHAKHDEPRISTLHGMMIDGSDEDENENASDSIRVTHELNRMKLM